MPKTSRQRRKMKMNQNQDAIKEYNQLVKERAPKSNLLQDCFRAFWVGGTICCIGQCIAVIMMNYAGASKDDASTWSSIILILIGSVLTGTGLYAKIGKYAGAGSIVPITGFSNSIVASAIEFKQEGYVMGVGSKLFTVAGPVIVYGVSSAVIAGIFYYIFSLFK